MVTNSHDQLMANGKDNKKPKLGLDNFFLSKEARAIFRALNIAVKLLAYSTGYITERFFLVKVNLSPLSLFHQHVRLHSTFML